ncbi:putative DCC family thiol-disulfide oxidoreductase YuxK [Dyadobacter sp. BE34]|uniref:DCC family thiol-disulfide oxidoreductase YuxK n=1 Tax=Dyadobacter fermentans TaxID=94254 RepID=A0ABU1QZG8_9BACT|nr:MULTISPECIES: DCC1-like thiol-disulfide oxidoreductase family protein [Dyadobacter]MDR6806505.1 putative DCC family thiol-disulfide oxidoreductase YuxK [Dyadobacter fermentans]MDR7044246.1 putative DCC family thiol-disulfide oxidoreductase YuxK [Dyadobacter sp. BE242]MDR7198557.1 putative DCC family thiol-disulfide oxidoreductase YuxK [Dyadobacter sp. BE34]MDR7216519.1 putative DCC family thiol-disulfide oxidoreductase YuxK [Dyadobacter sp. BE31]MDR7263955.1 putative DCC family thiol-disulf
MKTLHNHIILYDAECPMCNLYTGAFVRNGMLDTHGREAYQQYSGAACPNLDWQRAVNEIALVNQETGEVTYGIESLLKVCGNALPLLAPLFRWKPFLWIATKAYAFISYNRRVIIPAAASENQFGYQPSFNLKYRIAWLVFAWVMTSCILSSYTSLLTGFLVKGAFWREFAICGGQILFQGAVVFAYQKQKAWDYLGNMMTISLAGALVLLIFLTICLWLKLGWLISALCFMMVVFLMFLEHLRRCRLLGVGYLMTITWILYRIVTLAFLLM